MKRIKVVFLIATMQIGGQEQYLRQQITNMDQAKFEPILCCLKGPGPLADRVREANIKIFSGFQHFKYDFVTLWRFARFLFQEKPDILYLFDLRSVLFIGRLAARLARVPVCVAASHRTNHHGSGRSYSMLDRALIPLTDHFIAAAEAHRQSLVRNDGLRPEKITAIHNGVDLSRLENDLRFKVTREDLGVPAEAKIIGAVVRLSPEKSLDILLESSAQVMERIPETHLVIVGDGPDRARLISRAGELGIIEKVHFLGFRKIVAPIVSLFDVFALSSATETFSAATLEAMALGVPVVVTDVGSMAEMVVHGVTGYLVPPGDAGGLAATIASLLENKNKARALGEAGRARATELFTAGCETRQIEALFQSLLSQKMGAERNGPSTRARTGT